MDNQSRIIGPAGTFQGRRLLFNTCAFESAKVQSGPFSTTHKTYAFVYTLGTISGHINLNGKRHSGTRPAGVLSFFRPDDQIEGELDYSVDYESLHVCPSFVDQLIIRQLSGSRAMIASALCIKLPPQIHSAWTRLRSSMDQQTLAEPSVVEQCVELIVINALKSHKKNTSSHGAGANGAAMVRAVDYIQENIGENLDLTSIAREVGLSPFYFSRVFRTTYNTTVHRFILERRLQQALDRIRATEQSILHIALECGFCSQSHLTTAFRKRYGITPATFRKSRNGTSKF